MAVKVPFVLNFHPAVSGVRNIIQFFLPILRASDDMIRIFGEKPMVAFKRPRNFKDDLVHSKLRGESSFAFDLTNGTYKHQDDTIYAAKKNY